MEPVNDSDQDISAAAPEDLMWQRIGRYTVLGVLDQGGMGMMLKAHDEGLNRQVALKLYCDSTGHHWQRLEREAQALAKMAHPNAVQVFEVGEAGGLVFMAMELLEGQTLREWQHPCRPRHGWRKCVEVYLQAGQALAAAHAAGLVHGDFRPANCVIDDDNRVRVVNFGLVRGVEVGGQDGLTAEDAENSRESKDDALGSKLIQTGQTIGSLAYTAVEQLEGESSDARSDQFGFCVSLYEALYGTLPFVGGSAITLAASIRAGYIQASPWAPRVPARLRKVLRRGLAADPNDRWPNMNTLLTKLRRQFVISKPRRWLPLGVAVGMAAIGLGIAQYAEKRLQCTGAEKQLDGVWDEKLKREVRTSLLRRGHAHAPKVWGRVEEVLDRYAESWINKHEDICRSTRTGERHEEETADLRMNCLAHRKTALRSAVNLLSRANDNEARNAEGIVRRLPKLDHCDDVHASTAQPQELTSSENVEKAQDDFLHGLDLMNLGQHGEAVTQLTNAYTLATENEQYRLAWMAAEALAGIVGLAKAEPAAGLLWARTALMLAEKTGGAAEEARSRRVLGYTLASSGDYNEAKYHLAEVLRAAENSQDSLAIVTGMRDLGRVLHLGGSYGEAERYYQDILELYRGELTERMMVESLIDLGFLLLDQKRCEESEYHIRQSLVIAEQTWGPQDQYAVAGGLLLWMALSCQGKSVEAESFFDQGEKAMLRDAMGIDDPSVVSDMNAKEQTAWYAKARAHVLRKLDNDRYAWMERSAIGAEGMSMWGEAFLRQGKYEIAESYFRQTLEIRGRVLGESHPSMTKDLHNLGKALCCQKRHEEARRQYGRALEIQRHALGGEHPDLIILLEGLAIVGLAVGDNDAARKYAERAISIGEANEALPDTLIRSRVVLAHILRSGPGERPDVLALANRARDTLPELTSNSNDNFTEVTTWLILHHCQ